MKVLMLGNGAASLYSFRKELLKRLQEEENIKTIISVPRGMHYQDLARLSDVIIETDIDRRGKNIFHDIKLLNHYRRIMRKYRPDCVLSYTIKCNLYGGLVADLFGIPYMMNVTGLGSALKKSGTVRQIIMNLYQWTIPSAHCIFYQNKVNKEMFNKLHIRNSREILLPGSGVNLKMNSFEPYPKYGNRIRLLFVARIMHEKGIDVLTDAIKILRKKYKNLELHIVGALEENYRQKMQQWQEDGLVIYHGEQPDVHPFMKNCHALIHPSFYLEGMSNVCLEAAATGRPVITTDMPGCRETVEDGVTGYICKPDDIRSLTKAIEKFLTLSNEEKAAMGAAGRKRMEKHFDRNIVVDAYMKEIKKLEN